MRTNSFASAIFWLLSASFGFGGTTYPVGNYNDWPATWRILSSVTEASDEADGTVGDAFDFVGDSSNAGLYWQTTISYVFFRMRVDAGTFTTASGAHFLLIDIVGYGNSGIDYGFAWDSKSNDTTAHGLEMQVPATNGPTWGVSQMDDIDAPSQSTKLVNDINGFEGGIQRTTDGYVRTIDGQSTTNFGTTTFIDFAVSWNYLNTYTNLRSTQQWKITAASLSQKTDHNAFAGGDIIGAATSDSITAGWSNPIAVPEISSSFIIALAGFLGLFRRQRSSFRQ